MDEDDYFWFVARKKDIIRKRGENISGAELDRVIGGLPAVLEAAAIPVPRYVVLVDALPHTSTHRVEKFKMRKDPALRAAAVDLRAPRS